MIGVGKNTLKWYDLLIALGVGGLAAIIMYIFIGYMHSGLGSAATLWGDNMSQTMMIKTIRDTGWYFENDMIGAPYGAEFYNIPTYCTMNFESLIVWLILLFVPDVFAAYNIQVLFCFFLAGITAYLVLRALRINRLWSIVGGLAFGMAPYIQGRMMGHLCLAAAYFVPLSILLCAWCFEEDDTYLKLNKTFFKNPKNLLTIFFALLIANNGVAYYPFFTCFLLCVVALYKLVNEKTIKAIWKPLIPVLMICIFLGIALIPLVVYTFTSGTSSAMGTDRSVAMGEIYALKIAQLFIPTDSHGIDIIQKLINGYSQMPLNNENITAYNSVIAGIGFIGALLLCLNHKYVPNNHDYSRLFSILILCSVLFATIGGFSSLMFLVFRFIRCFNRISIFIMFLSLYVFLYFAQNLLISTKKAKHIVRYSSIGVLSLIVGIGLLDEILTRNKYAAAFDSNMTGIEAMEDYYQEVESVIQPNDMVIQLPYIGYPEGGQVGEILPDSYCLDYLTSSTIKWTFGSVKGSDSDRYYKYAASLAPEEMLKVIIPTGFKGIQIDVRGYEEETGKSLIQQFTDIIGVEPIVSEDGVKYFFNLYPYIESHPEVAEMEEISIEDIPVGE